MGQAALDHLFCSGGGSIRGKFGLGVWDQGTGREEGEGKNLDLAGQVHDLNQQEEGEFVRGGGSEIGQEDQPTSFLPFSFWN